MVDQSIKIWKTYALIVCGYVKTHKAGSLSLLGLAGVFISHFVSRGQQYALPFTNPALQALVLGLTISGILYPQMETIKRDDLIIKPLISLRIYKAILLQKLILFLLCGCALLLVYLKWSDA